MISITVPFIFLWISCTAEDYYYYPVNVTRSTMSGIAAYRSALTLDWLAAEDLRQREMAAAFETEPAPPSRILTTECIAYARPSTGKVAKLMLELLKNLEGDDAKLMPEVIQVLMRAKLLVETSMLEAEPDLDALVKTPGVMMGEPHVTFPRILAMIWMLVTDPATTKKFGWCPINRINKYIAITKSPNIANQMRALDPIIARARFIMEEFIQNVTPLNMYQKSTTAEPQASSRDRHPSLRTVKRPMRYFSTQMLLPLDQAIPSSTQDPDLDPFPQLIEVGNRGVVPTSYSKATRKYLNKMFIIATLFCL